ncbi:MAG: Fic family protein [bacterium]
MSGSIKKGRRYEETGFVEGQHEPGSRRRVLRNLLGIKKKREIERVELREQLRATEELIDTYSPDHRFTADDIRRIHRIWFHPIYAWAGEYRKVNMTKGGFTFAVAAQIPRLMASFEKDLLRKYTPCRGKNTEEIVHALAVVHTEFVLIHPFREGNGRVARMLATLMGLQAGLPALDFSGIRGRRRKEYFAAVQAGVARDYRPMEKIFTAVIRRTFRKRA